METHSPAEDQGSKKELEKEEPGTDLDGADDNASIDSLVSLLNGFTIGLVFVVGGFV